MATKSFTKDVRIKGKARQLKFVSALENARKKQSVPVVISKKVQELSENQIEKIFS